jgi:hypothetical protein
MTNFDVIKQMTVEELGKFLNHIDCANCAYYNDSDESTEVCNGHNQCKEGITAWLGQESSRWMSDYIKENNV